MPDRLKAYGPWPLRVMLAVGFVYHGLPKLTGAGHLEFSGMLGGMGVPAPELTAWLVGLVEVGGALALLLGYQVRLVVLPLLVEMLVALFFVHGPNGFNAIHITGAGPDGPVFGMPGAEFSLLYIALLVALGLTGAGPLSMDEGWELGEIPREPGLAAQARRRAHPTIGAPR